MTFGERVLALRTEKGMTQDELAIAVGYKSRSTIAKIEAGERDPHQSMIAAIAKALDTTPAYLMGWEDEWDKEAEEFEKESQNDAKMLMNYLSKLFDDAESVRIAYDLIISLARLNRNGLLELSKMLDIFSRADEYKSDSLKEVEKLNEI